MHKMNLTLSGFLIFFAVQSACAQTNLVFFGGGGDGNLSTTIFDSSIPTLGAKVNELGLKVQSCFDGGHATTETLVKNNISTANTDFTVKNYQAIIEDYAERINSGKIKSGEKLLIVMDTHGAEGNGISATHPIAMTGGAFQNATNLTGSTLGTMDDLKKLATLAQSKGVKLGIIDMSCHSGNSLSLANNNTCVITASGPNHFAFNSFANVFYSQMASGRSLEDVFLKTLESQHSPSFPMISTQAGKTVQQEEYALFSPYLNTIDADGKGDKLTPYLKAIANQKNCDRDLDFNKLIEQVKAMQALLGEQSNPHNHTPLIDALMKYKALQDQSLLELKNMNYGLYDQKKEKIQFPDPNNPSKSKTQEFTWRDLILNYPYSSLVYFQEELHGARNPAKRMELASLVAEFKAIDLKRNQILLEHPELKDAQTKATETFARLKTQSNEIYDLASNVGDLAQRMYQQRYQSLKSTESNSHEPCRDFVL
jgi:hypothetical protein